MDRRLFLRSLVAIAGAAALVPIAGEVAAAERRKDALRQGLANDQALPDDMDGDTPAAGASEAQYYYRRPYRRRFWRRPPPWRRRRMWARPMWRRPGWRRRAWRRRMWRRRHW